MTSEELARATGDGGELLLRRRAYDGAVELRVNGVFVMDTVHTETERMLATAMLELAPQRDLRVIVGGLGLGCTVHAVLADRRVRMVEVYELEADLVRWFRRGLVPGAGKILADPRVRLRTADVAAARTADVPCDAVLLDVDNGPGHLVHTGNTELYGQPALREWRDVLRPGGVFAVWSADPAPGLVADLRTVFGDGAERAIPGKLGDRRTDYYLVSARSGAA